MIPHSRIDNASIFLMQQTTFELGELIHEKMEYNIDGEDFETLE